MSSWLWLVRVFTSAMLEQNECWTSNHRAQHEARGEHLNLNGKVSPHSFSTESWKTSLEDMATWPRQHITCDFFSKNTPFLERIYLPCQGGYTYFAREVYPLWKVSTTSVEWHVMLGIPFLIIFSHTGHTLKKHWRLSNTALCRKVFERNNTVRYPGKPPTHRCRNWPLTHRVAWAQHTHPCRM